MCRETSYRDILNYFINTLKNRWNIYFISFTNSESMDLQKTNEVHEKSTSSIKVTQRPLKGLKCLKGFIRLGLLGMVHRAYFLQIHTSKHNNVIYKYIYLQGKTYTKTNLIYILYLQLQKSNIKQLVVIK